MQRRNDVAYSDRFYGDVQRRRTIGDYCSHSNGFPIGQGNMSHGAGKYKFSLHSLGISVFVGLKYESEPCCNRNVNIG